MPEQIRLIGVWGIWVGMMWVAGVAMHIGAKNNPRQPKISVGRLLTKLMTWGAVEGEVGIVPTLFQLNNLLFLLGVIIEYNLVGSGPPQWTIRIWFIAFVACGILARVISRPA